MMRKLIILSLVLVLVLACGVKLPVTGDSVNTAAHIITEPDEALSSLRDLPTVTPAPTPALVDAGEKGLAP